MLLYFSNIQKKKVFMFKLCLRFQCAKQKKIKKNNRKYMNRSFKRNLEKYLMWLYPTDQQKTSLCSKLTAFHLSWKESLLCIIYVFDWKRLHCLTARLKYLKCLEVLKTRRILFTISLFCFFLHVAFWRKDGKITSLLSIQTTSSSFKKNTVGC